MLWQNYLFYPQHLPLERLTGSWWPIAECRVRIDFFPNVHHFGVFSTLNLIWYFIIQPPRIVRLMTSAPCSQIRNRRMKTYTGISTEQRTKDGSAASSLFAHVRKHVPCKAALTFLYTRSVWGGNTKAAVSLCFQKWGVRIQKEKKSHSWTCGWKMRSGRF